MKILSVFMILISLGSLLGVLGVIGLGGGIHFDITLFIMILISIVSISILVIFTKELFKKI